jgi:hypothetical protein
LPAGRQHDCVQGAQDLAQVLNQVASLRKRQAWPETPKFPARQAAQHEPGLALVRVGGILPGMRAGRLGCTILLVEVMSRRVTATAGRCAE